MGKEDGGVGGAPERRRASQALVQEAGERVLVGPAVDLFAFDLLRRDVGGRPERKIRAERGGLVGEAPRQPEVGEVRVVACVEEDVGRLDVAVDEAASMRRVERTSDLLAEVDRSLRREGAVLK
jgi:hypothetical protein